MKHAKIGTLLSVFLLALLVVAPAVMAQGFPKAGPLGMKSKIELPLFVNGSFAESVLFDSVLHVNMGQAYQTSDGIRQVDFVATKWHAEGYSQVLGRKVTFDLTPGVAQPTSTATALTTGSDYPAVLTFRAAYDANIAGLTTLRRLPGLATGTVNSIPPGQSGLDVQKTIRFTDGTSVFEFKKGKCAHSSVAECEAVPLTTFPTSAQ